MEPTPTLEEQVAAALPTYQEFFDNLVASGVHPQRAKQQTTMKVRADIPGDNSPLEVALLREVITFA